MKRTIVVAVLILAASWATARSVLRWREERLDSGVTYLADWGECRDVFSRQGLSDLDLMSKLHEAGITALLLSASTVQDYLASAKGSEPRRMTFASRPLAEAAQRQLESRGMLGLNLIAHGHQFDLTNARQDWERLRDVEVGFNPELLGVARQAGLRLVLRVNNDPWLAFDSLFDDLQRVSQSNEKLGVLLNTDEVPGGNQALTAWESFLQSHDYQQLLFEFHPTKAALKLAARYPQATYRAHTIPSNELKDLTQPQARWRRAVQERACRFLLFHISPTDNLTSYLDNVRLTQRDLMAHGWTTAWPKTRVTWTVPGFLQRNLGQLLALGLAILLPVVALRIAIPKNPWNGYMQVIVLTFLGACVVAALAENSLTRIEVIPFRGIKLAFVGAWVGSFFMLFSWRELRDELFHAVRRVDILVGVGVLAVVGYLMIRSGNASAGWKVGWEQGLRDHMENLFVARPRFKEFALGYPLLLLGFHLKRRTKRFWQDGRFWIAVGMIGPISMVNTFCHLHSPLYLAFWRSFNGFVMGTLLGMALVSFVKRGGFFTES